MLGIIDVFTEVRQQLPVRQITRNTSEVITPVPPSAHLLPVIPQIEVTGWEALYEPRHVEKDYYFEKLCEHCVEVNGTNSFSLVQNKV